MKTLLAAVIPARANKPSVPRRRLSDRLSDVSSAPTSDAASSNSIPARLPFGRRSTDLVECPKCGKRSIIARTHNTFDCLNCNFHRELPPVASVHKSVAQPLGRHADSLNRPLSRSFNPLMSSGSYRSSLELEDVEQEADSSQPLLFAVIAVIFGILLL